jgi:hypothetical protein
MCRRAAGWHRRLWQPTAWHWRALLRTSRRSLALRLWLRLLTCTQLIEKQVRAELRERFDRAYDEAERHYGGSVH